MRKALLPILAAVLLLLTGVWAFDVFVGLGGGETALRGYDGRYGDEFDPIERDRARAPADTIPPRVEERTPVTETSLPRGERTRPPRVALTGQGPDPGAASRPALPNDENVAAPTTTTGTTGVRPPDVRVGTGGVGKVDEEVWLEPGLAWIGSTRRWVDGIEQRYGMPEGTLQSEVPWHRAEIPDAVWIERFEVTNERYRTFLEQTSLVQFEVPLDRARTLVDIAGVLVVNREATSEIAGAARQLWNANRAAVNQAVFGEPGGPVEPGSREDEALWEAVKDERLPRGLKLRFYDRAPPSYWPDERYPAGREDHPVRDLSLDDALAVAIWAGKHLPSEITWEYAARGPRGFDYPWGASGRDYAERVNGGRVLEEGERPDTLPVRSLEAGASWCGCHHMLGNVAEWTGSWPWPYPGSTYRNLRVGTPRGGSAANTDPVYVRPALRGYAQGTSPGELARPARSWIGVRLARYPEPARSRVPCMQMRVRLNPLVRVAPEVLEPRVYAGVEGRLERRIFETRQDASVRMGAKAFVVQPLRAVARETDGPGGIRAFEPGVGADVVDPKTLVAASAHGLVLLGILHNDLRLLDAYVPYGRRTLVRPSLLLHRGFVPPDSWWICLYRGHLALWAPQRTEDDRWRFLTRRPVRASVVNVRTERARGDEPPRPRADLTFENSRLVFELQSWLGNSTRPELVVRVRFASVTEGGVVSRVSDWTFGRLTE